MVKVFSFKFGRDGEVNNLFFKDLRDSAWGERAMVSKRSDDVGGSGK